MSSYANHPQQTFELIKLINEYRASKGAQPLIIDHTLMDLSQSYTEFLDAKGVFSHTADGQYPWVRIDKSGFVHEPGLTGSAIGNENLHYGYSSRTGYHTPQEALEGWINSSGHNRNMLDPDWDRVGIGYKDGLYTANFGDGPDGATPPDAPPPPPPAPTPTLGKFSYSRPVSFELEAGTADYVRVKLGDIVDQNGSVAAVRFEALNNGQVVARGTANVQEPGTTVKWNPTRGFDEVRIKAAETDVTGSVLDVDWFLFNDTPTTPPSPPGDIGAYEKRVIELTNEERAERGIAPLKSNAELNEAADRHAEDMAANKYFSHQGLDGDRSWDRAEEVGYSSRGFGENIAWGQDTPEQVVAAWMNSPGHRSNLLNPSWKDIGVGYENEYWVQNFGTGDTNPASLL